MIVIALLVVAISHPPGFARAKSSGASGCSYKGVPIGKASINPADPSNKNCEGCIMPWVTSPEKTTRYYWRTGNSLNVTDDRTTYRPDSLMVLYLRTRNLVDAWAGIHVRAVQASDPQQAVGGWEFPTDEPFKEVEGCARHVLTHSNPKPKLLKQRFFFKTPPAGTGTIHFETLIKKGPQSQGSFYWPTVDLVLDEAEPTPTTNSLVLATAEATESCESTCSRVHLLGCRPTQNDIFEITNQVCSITFNVCDNAGPGVGDNLVCYACAPPVGTGTTSPPDSNSNASGKTIQTNSTPTGTGTACSVSSQTRPRLCDCHGPPKIKPPKVNHDVSTSAAQQSTPHRLLLVLLALFSWAFASSASSASSVRSLTGSGNYLGLHCAYAFVVGLLLVQPAGAHNWMNNKGRAVLFNAGKPPARTSPEPHVQVNAGQLFQAEWSLGHGRQPDHWFILMKAEDEGKVPESPAKVQEMVSKYLGDYKQHNGIKLDSGPSGLWRKNFIGHVGGCGNNITDHIKLDPKYKARYKIKPHLNGPGQHTAYPVQQKEIMPPSKLLADIRVQYTHPDYPFIISGHKFKANDCGGTWNHQIANFEVPENYPPGQYILYYSWNGAYSDILDINVHAKADQIIKDDERYGGDSADIAYEWVRKEHCEFWGFNVKWGVRDPGRVVESPGQGSKPELSMTKCFVAKDDKGLPNADNCMQACDEMSHHYCSAVAVVRKTNPKGPADSPVADFLPNIPYQNFRNSRPQCRYSTSHDLIENKCEWNNDRCRTPEVMQAADDEYICYGLSPKRLDWLETYTHVTTDDPMDPKFYSTCFMKKAVNHFYPLANIAKPPPLNWRVGDRCLRCGAVKDFPAHCKEGAVRDWVKHLLPEDQCANCDGEPENVPSEIGKQTCW